MYKLIWYQEFDLPEDAILIEKKIDGWIRAEKIALIESVNPSYQDLSTVR